MTESQFVLDKNGFLVPPSFGGTAAPVFEAQRAHAEEFVAVPAVTPAAWLATRPVAELRPRAPQRPAGRLNWIFGMLSVVTGVASFAWPLVSLTVLVGLALSAVGISRANRLRHRGATGRGIAILGLVIGLASAANLVFGFTSLAELSSQLGGLLP